MHSDDRAWKDADLRKIDLVESSPLYKKLCAEDSNGDCTFPGQVVLDENLVYNDTDLTEYAPDTLRTVRIRTGSLTIWYEYLRQPCVELAFYDDGIKINRKITNQVMQNSMCGNPQLEVAVPACIGPKDRAEIHCHYQNERMSYDSAVEMCASVGLPQGHPGAIRESEAGPCGKNVSFEKICWLGN